MTANDQRGQKSELGSLLLELLKFCNVPMSAREPE